MKNLKSLVGIVLILFTTSAIQSCNDDDDIRMSNQSFVTQASSSNTFEIQAGQLANTKGQDQRIKDYGTHMIADHTAVGLEMAALATAKGWSIPNNLQPKEQTNLNRLNAVTGAQFDQEFIRIMVASHEDAVDLFTSASGRNGVPDSTLRNFAEDKLPALKTHLEQARSLDNAL